MVRWELESKHPSTSFGKIVKRHVSTADAINVDRMISAYEALWKGKFKSADDIRHSFTKNGEPLFTPEQAEIVYKNIRKQTGGDQGDSVLNSTIESGLNMAAGITPPSAPSLPPGATAAMQNGLKTAQMVIRIVLPFIFVLDTLEHSPLFGDILGASLDVMAATLPVIASTIQTMTPGIVGLIPIPLAGTVGIILGWMFSLFFLWLAAVIGLSRKDFAAALEATSGMVPVIGPALSRGVKAVDTVGTKISRRAERIMQSITQTFGSLKGAIENVKNKVGSVPGLDKFAGPNAPKIALPSIADIKNKVRSALPAPIPPAPSAPPFDENPAPPPPSAPPVDEVPQKTAFPPVPARKGGRFTRRKGNTNRRKWATTKKHRR